MDFKIDLNDGKYTYVFDNGVQKALRDGRPWRDLTGDNLIYFMAMRIQELEEQNEKVSNKLDSKIMLEELKDLAEDLAVKQEGSYSGVQYSEHEGNGVRVSVYTDFWDFLAGTNSYWYSYKDLKGVHEKQENLGDD